MEPTMGEVRLFAGDYAPRNWMLCHGQLLLVSDYTALHAILGYAYGGNGKDTFALPDLRGRAALGVHDPLLPMGRAVGSETLTLKVDNLPMHGHSLACSAADNTATSNSPAQHVPAAGALQTGTSTPVNNRFAPVATPGIFMHVNALGAAGYDHPEAIDLMMPSIALNFIICIQGLFPNRR